MRFTIGLIAALLVSFFSSKASAHSTEEAMFAAANVFLASLDDGQRARTEFKFEGKERKAWDFVPKKRDGLPLKAMSPAQRKHAMDLIRTVLSHNGMKKAEQIMSLEQVLFEMEKQNPKRDPKMYHFQFFGKPSMSEPWGWRVEGHHLSLNVTLPSPKDGSIESAIVTPAFWGANPGKVPNGPKKGLRVLGKEEDLGRELVKSLTKEHLAVALFDKTAPRDVINGPGKEPMRLEPAGISADKLNDKQQALLMSIIEEYVNNFRKPLAARDLAQIKSAGISNLHFAWAGGLEMGEPHYFRIQGPTMIFEYDNVQGGANHVHYVWRDSANDFGRDVLKEHYEAAHAQ
jgi:hypothetical protein